MSDEISVFARVVLNNNGLEYSFSPNYKTDQNSQGASGGVASVATSEEVLSFTDISTEGIILLRSLEAEGGNYVTYGPESGGSMVPFGRINPQECAILRLEPGITWRWQADTSACKVNYMLLED